MDTPEQNEVTAAEIEVKPKLRGVFHVFGALVALTLLYPLIQAAPENLIWPTIVYGVGTVLLLGISGSYHVPNWRPEVRAWWRRLDHTMIFVHIAGSFTPFTYYVLKSELSTTVFWLIWSGVLFGAFFNLVWVEAPKWLRSSLYVIVGWLGVLVLPELMGLLGMDAIYLIFGGGIIFTIGAIIYSMKRPDPFPKVFGYHEIFHLLVLIAVFMHFWAIYYHVLPFAEATELSLNQNSVNSITQ